MAALIQSSPVLIAGAGPTGLMMACELNRHGIPCRVIDKESHPTDKSKALVLHTRTLEILYNMGLVDEALSIGSKCYGMSLFHGDRRLAHFTFDDVESPFPYALMIAQCETERILREHLQGAGVAVERPVELTSFDDEGNCVNAKLRNQDGREEVVETPWLIGCDGAHSTVRHTLQMPFEGEQYEERFALADVIVDGGIPHDDITTFFHEEGALVFFPFGGRFRVMGNVTPEQVAGDAPSLEWCQQLVDKRGRQGLKLSDPKWLAWFKINKRSVSKYNRGRVFLVGDAAHIHSPVGGQGMNTGMQDAYNLAWKLALVIRGDAGQELLDSYSAERHAVGQALLKGTDIATRVATLRHPVGQEIRNKIIPFLSQQDFVHRRMEKVATMVAVNYRHSPIVAQSRELKAVQVIPSPDSEEPTLPAWVEFGRGPLPGDRAVDAPLQKPSGETVQLFEAVRGTSHNLFLFDGRPTPEGYRNFEAIAGAIQKDFAGLIDVHAIVAGRDASVIKGFAGTVWLDPTLDAHHSYAADSECLYLIRPDGYVGYRGQPARLAPLLEYLAKIFEGVKVTAESVR